MPSTPAPALQIGDWRLDTRSGQLLRNGDAAQLDLRALRLLLCLAEHPGEVVSIDTLLTEVWPEVTVSPDSVYQAITSLRRTLGDDPKQPAYIATVPRLGYRMIAAVAPAPDASTIAATKPLKRRISYGWAAAVLLCAALAVFALLERAPSSGSRPASVAASAAQQPQNSIAVLPFLDLTSGMNEEEFADGMTEEIIDKISKLSGIRVASATSSFYFKGKQLPVAHIARSLHVVYVLDGSVRKSGPRLRVAARLVRAENGYVLWSETYDRPFTDRIAVQDSIASEVSRALQAAIAAPPTQSKP